MPVSLGRRIRRIGLVASTFDNDGKFVKQNFNENLSDKDKQDEISKLRAAAFNNRTIRRDMQQSPAKEHRRSKSRIKRGREDKVVVKGKK